MHPRTVAITAVAVLVGAFVLRFVVVHFGLLPVSAEVVLKKAEAITVHYFDSGKKEVFVVADSGQVSDLLATLQIKRGDGDRYYWGGSSPQDVFVPTIMFHFPSSQTSFQLFGPKALGGYEIDEAFYRKINEVISERRGHAVDILRRP